MDKAKIRREFEEAKAAAVKEGVKVYRPSLRELFRAPLVILAMGVLAYHNKKRIAEKKKPSKLLNWMAKLSNEYTEWVSKRLFKRLPQFEGQTALQILEIVRDSGCPEAQKAAMATVVAAMCTRAVSGDTRGSVVAALLGDAVVREVVKGTLIGKVQGDEAWKVALKGQKEIVC